MCIKNKNSKIKTVYKKNQRSTINLGWSKSE